MTQLFEFRPLTNNDFDILSHWHAEPHIIEWWGEKRSPERVKERYTEKLSHPGIEMYIILIEGREIGFIQAYNAPLVGGDWWPDATPGTWGIDQFIGEPDLLGHGLGSAFVREFSNRLLERDEVRKVITDPSPENKRAIRAYEKAGFQYVEITITPDGPAHLMEKAADG